MISVGQERPGREGEEDEKRAGSMGIEGRRARDNKNPGIDCWAWEDAIVWQGTYRGIYWLSAHQCESPPFNRANQLHVIVPNLASGEKHEGQTVRQGTQPIRASSSGDQETRKISILLTTRNNCSQVPARGPVCV